MEYIDLIASNEIYCPGVLENSHILNFSTEQGKKISRFRISLSEPVTIESCSYLFIELRCSDPRHLLVDILKGDVGLPEINLVTESDGHFRFKRGNIKDFIDIKNVSEKQSFALPVNSFLINTDLVNQNYSANLFSEKIKTVYFDFLGSADGCIKWELYRVGFINEPTRSLQKDLNNIVQIGRVGGLGIVPVSVTEGATIKYSITPISPTALLHNLTCEVRSIKNKHIEKKSVFLDKEEGVSLYLSLPFYDEYEINFELVSTDNIRYKHKKNICRLLRFRDRQCDFLGVSESYYFDELNYLGCKYKRIVINLSSIGYNEVKDEFYFAPDTEHLRVIAENNGNDVVVALKGMPKWLSRKGRQPDFYRYAPSSIGLYEKMLAWLFNKINKKNIFAVETFNEANVIHEWNDDFWRLGELQKAAFKVKKSIDAKFKLLSPSSTSWDFDFFETLKDNSVYSNCDGMALHAYTYSPENMFSFFKKVSEFSNLMKENAEVSDDFGVYITEVGFRTPAFSNYYQSLWLSLLSIYAFFNEDIRLVMWFRYKNSTPESTRFYDQNSSNGYSMLGYGGEYSRPAICSFAFINFILSDLLPLSSLHDKEETLFMARTKISNEEILISYSEKKEHNKAKFFSFKNCYDIYGNKLSSPYYDELVFLSNMDIV